MDNSHFGIDLAKLQESIFKQDIRWKYNTFLRNRFDIASFGLYAMGYKDTADHLVEHATRIGQDFVVYPIMFLYRHYIELSLKNIFYISQQLQDLPVKEYREHNILILWEKVMIALKNVPGDYFGEFIPVVLDNIKDRLEEFNKLDPGSFSFRYPTDSDNIGLPEENIPFNIRQVQEVMSEISKFLDVTVYGLDCFLETKKEYETEMRREYD